MREIKVWGGKKVLFEFKMWKINKTGKSRCGEAKEFEFEGREINKFGNQGVASQKSFNLNLKGGKLINYWEIKVWGGKKFEFEFK